MAGQQFIYLVVEGSPCLEWPLVFQAWRAEVCSAEDSARRLKRSRFELLLLVVVRLGGYKVAVKGAISTDDAVLDLCDMRNETFDLRKAG